MCRVAQHPDFVDFSVTPVYCGSYPDNDPY